MYSIRKILWGTRFWSVLYRVYPMLGISVAEHFLGTPVPVLGYLLLYSFLVTTWITRRVPVLKRGRTVFG